VLQNLKLDRAYHGFLFLAESARNPPSLRSHHHAELELNLVARGTVTYVTEEGSSKRGHYGTGRFPFILPFQKRSSFLEKTTGTVLW
jgi:hypothetical protein